MNELENHLIGQETTIFLDFFFSNNFRLLETPTKTPLAIVDLNMSPEAKTMVQRDVKKDPKKPPPFCKQYTHSSRLSLFHDEAASLNIVPQLLVKGTVFSYNTGVKSDDFLHDVLDPNGNTYDITPIPNHSPNDSGSISLSGSCESIADNASVNGRHHKTCLNAPLAVQKFILNLEQYGMDKDGRLPGLARATSPQCLGPLQPLEHAPPSPTTRQIIRVDVTMNKEKMESDRFRQVGNSIGNGFTTRGLIRDKRGRLKLNSSYI